MVSYNNVWWYATRDNVEVTPSESDRTWVALLKFSADLLTFDNHETTLRSSTFQNALAELAKRGAACDAGDADRGRMERNASL